jgi:thymidylate synthase
MFRTLDAETADELWQKAALWFSANSSAPRQTSRAGDTREIMNAALTLRDSRQRWIASRAPAMNPAFAIAEVVWILCGRNDSAMLNYFNPILPRYAGDGDTYHGAYGHRLRHHFGVDQLDRAYKALSANAGTRQVVLQLWDSTADLPDETGLPANKDVPCNISSLLKVRNGRLEWTQIMRSNDLFRGLPHNVIQFSSVQEVLAGWLGLTPGAYHHFSDSLHLYGSDGDVHSCIETTILPPNSDSLAVAKEESDDAFQVLSKHCDFLAGPDTSTNAILDSTVGDELPEAHRNFAIVLTADAIRRRGMLEEAIFAMNRCTNPCLNVMFERWMRRCHRE